MSLLESATVEWAPAPGVLYAITTSDEPVGGAFFLDDDSLIWEEMFSLPGGLPRLAADPPAPSAMVPFKRAE